MTDRRAYSDPDRWSDLKVASREVAAEMLSRASGKIYVYVLCEPDGHPFYIGKGAGRRVFQHEADAWNERRLSHKLNVIRRIQREGGSIRYAVPGLFDDAESAYAHERELVRKYGRLDLGLGPLTNQNDGGDGGLNPSAEAQARHAASLGGEAEDPERRIANQFLASIAGQQASIPVKPWRTIQARAHLLRPSPRKPVPVPTSRMAKAIVASAVANGVLLKAGALIPRKMNVKGVTLVIENGCGGDMVQAGLVEPVEPCTEPLKEVLRLTPKGLAAMISLLGRDALVSHGVLEP